MRAKTVKLRNYVIEIGHVKFKKSGVADGSLEPA